MEKLSLSPLLPGLLILIGFYVPSFAQTSSIVCGDSTTNATFYNGQYIEMPHANQGSEYFEIDLDGDNLPDFEMRSYAWTGSSGSYWGDRLEPKDSSRLIHYTYDSVIVTGFPPPDLYQQGVAQLTAGDTVDSSLDWVSKRLTVAHYSIENFAQYNFLPFDSGYVGLQIATPEFSCFGWLLCNKEGDVFGYASNCRTLTSRAEPKPELSISLGPNPSEGQFSIRFLPPKKGPFTVEIRDLQGKLLQSRNRTATMQQHVEVFQLQDQPRGIYLVEVRQGDARWNSRVVLQ